MTGQQDASSAEDKGLYPYAPQDRHSKYLQGCCWSLEDPFNKYCLDTLYWNSTKAPTWKPSSFFLFHLPTSPHFLSGRHLPSPCHFFNTYGENVSTLQRMRRVKSTALCSYSFNHSPIFSGPFLLKINMFMLQVPSRTAWWALWRWHWR